ncbi:MAG: S41 family peptidase [Gammaproteobacteria bacterium]|nr:S41 family peptidase [Gammaproteobacteria bacterium]NNJ49367.1 S41 family peptidase [Gammaproteobacteria bacterium]
MSNQYKTVLVLVFGIFVGVSVSITSSVLAEKNADESVGLPLNELRNFSDIFARVKSDYVEEVDDKTLLEHAIRGMLTGLDPHSTYLNNEEYKELKIGTTGKFGGLGIQVGMEDGFVKVISPIDDTPAYRAGLEAGDLIIRLNDKSVKGMTLNDAVKIMRGEPGTDIKLTVIREGADKPLPFTVTRDIISVKSVKSRILEPDYGYIRISNFQSKTARDLVNELSNLKKENKNELKGLVLDLRNNPGGVLSAAADVSDAFIDEGKLVYTEGRIANSDFEFNAKPGDIMNGSPLVVLINGGSASASEIVAGALQDHKRAVVMGSKSFGKGSVQTIQELRSGGAVKITTARYFTPSGRSIQGEGITPDIILDSYEIEDSKEDGTSLRIKESDLSGSISNPTKSQEAIKKAVEEGKKGEEKEEKIKASDDFQLFEALLLLKGLNILSKS